MSDPRLLVALSPAEARATRAALELLEDVGGFNPRTIARVLGKLAAARRRGPLAVGAQIPVHAAPARR